MNTAEYLTSKIDWDKQEIDKLFRSQYSTSLPVISFHCMYNDSLERTNKDRKNKISM